MIAEIRKDLKKADKEFKFSNKENNTGTPNSVMIESQSVMDLQLIITV